MKVSQEDIEKIAAENLEKGLESGKMHGDIYYS